MPESCFRPLFGPWPPFPVSNPDKKLLSWPEGPAGSCLRAAVSLLAGLFVALVLDYLMYRVGLPSKPFIYVSF